jgi:hypothetical protein
MNGECLQLRMDGQFQTLYENAEGQMSTDSLRFNSMLPLPSATENQTELWLQESSQPELLPTADGFNVISSYPVTVQTYSGRTLPMVTELDVGQQREADPDRPSILLRRAGDEGLWAIAKGYGSTVDAIMEANQLSGEPENGQMLLIPIVMNLTVSEMEVFKENKPVLEEFGFEAEEFGKDGIIIRQSPITSGDEAIKGLMAEMLEGFSGGFKNSVWDYEEKKQAADQDGIL